MKKLLLSATCFATFSSFAQQASDSLQYQYCQIVGQTDWTAGRGWVSVQYAQGKKKVFYDGSDKSLKYQTSEVSDIMLDALNSVSAEGWELVHAYSIYKDPRIMEHWILRRRKK